MSLVAIIKIGMEKIAKDPESKDYFVGFEGESVGLNLIGDSPVTIKVEGARSVVFEGELQDTKVVADVLVHKFLGFIDGSTPFGGLFISEYLEYFRARKGEFDEMGGDFALLNPVSDRLINLYKEDAEFRETVDSFARSI